ncbi:hypothetical protein L1987_85814 [Smallanthus sonchifolius]|uniref:Uncharacterized protein n=1 Tax=Smallanthus sonchifolius TaxID=185202 RepID=A0ACB8XY82_9ASTR|nr:hypothetical protein L1987_85814 [Smallanthus sonchifolius]
MVYWQSFSSPIPYVEYHEEPLVEDDDDEVDEDDDKDDDDVEDMLFLLQKHCFRFTLPANPLTMIGIIRFTVFY